MEAAPSRVFLCKEGNARRPIRWYQQEDAGWLVEVTACKTAAAFLLSQPDLREVTPKLGEGT